MRGCAVHCSLTTLVAVAVAAASSPVRIRWELGPDYPMGIQDSAMAVLGDILISAGGFTIDHAEQTTVLSLPALRRLRFPAKPGEKSSPEGDVAARTYLGALGLLGATLAVEAGYDLRSRCILRAKNAVTWQLLGKPGDPDTSFALDRAAAVSDELPATGMAVPVRCNGSARPAILGVALGPGRSTQTFAVQGFARSNVMRTYPDPLFASNAVGRSLSRFGALSHVVSVSPSRA